MKAIILLNGEPYEGIIDVNGSYVYCCDGAYRWAKGMKIDENLGDYDSLDYIPTPPPTKIYPQEKNLTDGEIALRRALKAGAEEIVIYGGGGGRDDHFLGNLHLLYLAEEHGVRASLVTNYSRIFVAGKEALFLHERGKTLSVIPFGGDAHIVESRGLKYPLTALTLRYGSTRGISNVIEEDEAFFTVSGGKVLVAVNTK